MQKTRFFLVFLCSLAALCYADDTTNGYLMSIYGGAVKSAYGSCVHTAYYNPDADGRSECGDAKEVASAPVLVDKPKIIIESVTMSDADNVLFNFNVSTLTPAGITAITNFGKKLGSEPDITKVTIDGYTDALGKEAYNINLSTDRANAVKQLFIKDGVPANVITTNGYGSKGAKTANECFAKYGNDNINQIWQVQSKLNTKKYKAKEKKRLQTQLNALQAKRNDLIECMASDRKVVFTIEHTKQVQKTVMEKVPASGTVSMEGLAKPPIDSE